MAPSLDGEPLAHRRDRSGQGIRPARFVHSFHYHARKRVAAVNPSGRVKMDQTDLVVALIALSHVAFAGYVLLGLLQGDNND